MLQEASSTAWTRSSTERWDAPSCVAVSRTNVRTFASRSTSGFEPEAVPRPRVPSSRPGLQLDEVAIGIGRVAPRHVAAVGGRERDDLAEAAAAGRDDRIQRGRHVRHLEGDVAPAGAVDLRATPGLHRVVLVDLERRARRPVARQAQMRAGQMRAGDPGRRLQVRAAVVALGRHELQAEELV